MSIFVPKEQNIRSFYFSITISVINASIFLSRYFFLQIKGNLWCKYNALRNSAKTASRFSSNLKYRSMF